MNNLESAVLSYLFNSLWQVPLLFAAGWLMARLAKKVSVEAEHRVWVLTLLLQCFLPACSAAWPHLPSVWSWFGQNSASPDPHVSVLFGAGEYGGGFHFSSLTLAIIAFLYAGVCVFFVARFLWRCRRLMTLSGDSVPVELTGPAAQIWRQCSRQFDLEGALLGASAQLFAPVTLGIRKKLILLPAGLLAQLPESDLHTVIAHEFAHLRRKDFAKNLLYEFLSLPMSYHPLFWSVRERMIESREMVCDALAAQLSGRDAYARSLLRLASLLVAGIPIRTPHAIGIFDANILERRLMRLTQTHSEPRVARRVLVLAACMLVGAAACASALTLATNVDGAVALSGTASGDSPKAKARQTVPASEMVNNLISKVQPIY